MRDFSFKCARISDPRMEVVFSNVEQFVLYNWTNCLKEEKKISDGLNSIKFLKFDQILQQQLYNISFPMIRFRFFGASKTTRKLSKSPKIMTMAYFGVEINSDIEGEKLILDIKDFVFFVSEALIIQHFDFFKSKLFYAINTCDLRSFSIQLPTMDQVLQAVDLIPNVWGLDISLQDENLAVNSNDFEALTRKIGKKTKLYEIDFINFNLPNNWERVCKENFKNLSNLSDLSITDPIPDISINVIDLHDLITENNIAVGIWNIQDDSFVELPEFKDRFSLKERSRKRLYISKNHETYYAQPL